MGGRVGPASGYEEADQPTAAVEAVGWEQSRKRFPTSLHGYDRAAVDEELAALEREIDELRAQRTPAPVVEAEIERIGEETSAIIRVAHEQASEITRRARVEAERCVADAAANAVSMTEDAKRKLRQLDSETDAVWAERGRLIEDVRNVATALFSLAEDAADRFPEDGERGGGIATVSAPAPQAARRARQPRPRRSQAAAPPAQAASPPPAAGGLRAAEPPAGTGRRARPARRLTEPGELTRTAQPRAWPRGAAAARGPRRARPWRGRGRARARA